LSSRAEILFGTNAVEPPARTFAVGALSFELVAGNLRAVRLGEVELIRAIQYLVRDRDWCTLAPTISHLKVEEGEGLSIRYCATCRSPDGARLVYVATIEATGDRLDFSVEAVAASDFTTNRLGFCVLHPAGLTGAPVRVEHCDGTIEPAVFPVLIDPYQPFTDIRALTHERDGVTVECRMDGDSFEMEDQRNWSDASYKTYVRPLARPWPYVVPAGASECQRISLRIFGAPPPRPAAAARGEIALGLGEKIGTIPRIGLVVTPAEAEATLAHARSLACLGVGEILLGFDHAAGHGAEQMAALARVAAATEARLTLECVLGCDGDLDSALEGIARQAREAGLAPDSLALFPAPDLQSTPPGSLWPTCPPLEEVYAAARRAFPGVTLGGGMYGYFTELNRKRPPLGCIDFVTHATCPIVHDAGDDAVMQTLEALPHIFRSARAIFGDMPYRLGPSTIAMRQNPYGSRTMANPERRRIAMAGVDHRQDGRFAAAWTIGYAAATETARLDLLTLGALTGPLGLIGDAGRRPIFRAVQDLGGISGQTRLACHSSAPDKVAALASASGDRTTLLVANLTAAEHIVRMDGVGAVTLDAYSTRKFTVSRS
jgi:hypothetical protein